MGRFEGYPRLRLIAPDEVASAGTGLEAFLADTAWRRALGLALLAAPPGGALLIPRCASVHTVGMRFAIDVAFLAWQADAPGRPALVLEVRAGLRPLRAATLPRRSRPARRAELAVLELAAGRAAELGIEPGAELRRARR